MEERVFKIKSKSGDKEYMSLQEYTSKKILVPLCIICSLVFVVLGAIYLFSDLFTGIMFLVVAAVFPFIYVKFYKKEINKKKYKPATVSEDVVNYTEFSEDGFCEKTFRREEQIGVTSLKYTDLVKLVDYKGYFFVYISKMQAFIIDKSGFVVGTAEDLKSFLAEKGVKIVK